MTSGGQKPVLVFTHRRDATLLLMTLQRCTSRTKPRFSKTFVCPSPSPQRKYLGSIRENERKPPRPWLGTINRDSPKGLLVRGAIRSTQWSDSPQGVERFAPPLISQQSPVLHVFFIEALRQWASGRCLSADRVGVYSRAEGARGGQMRRVMREPGVNWGKASTAAASVGPSATWRSPGPRARNRTRLPRPIGGIVLASAVLPSTGLSAWWDRRSSG